MSRGTVVSEGDELCELMIGSTQLLSAGRRVCSTDSMEDDTGIVVFNTRLSGGND